MNQQQSFMWIEEACASMSQGGHVIATFTLYTANPLSVIRKNFIFKRCFQGDFNPNEVPGSEVILAENSEEDS